MLVHKISNYSIFGCKIMYAALSCLYGSVVSTTPFGHLHSCLASAFARLGFDRKEYRKLLFLRFYYLQLPKRRRCWVFTSFLNAKALDTIFAIFPAVIPKPKHMFELNFSSHSSALKMAQNAKILRMLQAQFLSLRIKNK